MASPPRHAIWRTVLKELWKAGRRQEVDSTSGNRVLMRVLQKTDPETYRLLPAELYGGQPVRNEGSAASIPTTCATKAVRQSGSTSWKALFMSWKPPVKVEELGGAPSVSART